MSQEKESAPSGPEILTRSQLAARYGIHEQTWYKWDKEGIGPPSFRINRMVRYRAADVEAWLENHRRGGKAQ